MLAQIQKNVTYLVSPIPTQFINTSTFTSMDFTLKETTSSSQVHVFWDIAVHFVNK